MHSGNVDTLAFQTALVGLVYIISYLAVGGLAMALPAEASKPLWGFFFFFGLIFAMAVQLVVVWQYLLPISAICLIGGFATLAVALHFGRRLDKYGLERLAAVYGITTGTVSSGLLLLRIAAPQFKTPVALEAGIMNIISVPVIVGSMVLVNAPVWWGWSLLAVAGAHLIMLAVCVAIMLTLKLIGKKSF